MNAPPQADAEWIAGVQRSVAEKEYEASRNEQGLQAPNRAHDLRTYFEPTGIRVVDRTREGGPDLLGMSLSRWGRADGLAPVAPGEVTSRGNRVEIRRADLVEWYENTAAGLEQGFTLGASPAGEGALVLELSVAAAALSPEKDGLVLTAPNGRRLEYGGLVVRDDAGTRLPARLEVGENGVLRIAVEDAAARYPVTVDPLLTSTSTLQADQVGANLGFSVAGIGDVNGDGYADVAVGAPSYDAGQNEEGAAFVFLGSAAGVANGGPATCAATLQSDQVSAFLGYSLAGAGDVNGDGYADLVVGATNYDDGQTDEGAAFVFLGSASGIPSGSVTAASAVLQSDQAAAFLGSAVAAADVNADGYSDVVVGAYAYTAGHSAEGAAFVFLGGAAGVASGNPATAAATLQGDQTSSQFGWSLAGAGDVNGDGYADVIVGAPYYDAGQTDEGAAFVFVGSAAGIASGNPGSAATTLRSDQASAFLGFSVAGAGDVNGDGYSDVIAGAFYYDRDEANEGAAFVFAGSPSGIASATPAGALATLQSNQVSAFLGWSVAGAGDVDGDGYADVIAGAPYYDAGQADEGAVFVFIGGPSGLAPAGIHESNQAASQFGRSVAGAGDVNGDGLADVILGAPAYDLGEAEEGAAFTLLGGAMGVLSGIPPMASTLLQANQAGSYLGMGVAGAGDVNGDGYGDVIVGSYYFDLGQADEGAAFVFLGSAAGVSSVPSATLQTNQLYGYMGYSVAGAGDVNGDGYADVIVGAFGYESGQADEGAAFVFLGSPTGVASGDPSTAAAILQADQGTANFGANVSGAGDVNGDGYADVIVGADKYDSGEGDEGAAFIFLGSATGIASGNPTTAATVLQGNQASARLGQCVAAAGDVNGDGYADVIVGAPYYDSGQTNEGAAFVFLGSATGVASAGPATAATMLQSNQSSATLGTGVAGAGDVNRDGYADVIVGAYGYDLGQSEEGAAFVFHGSSAGVPSGSPATAATTLQSDQAMSYFGMSVAGAGDVNGDGYADVIVGGPYFDAAGLADAGAAFLFLGSPTGVASSTAAAAAATLHADQESALLGRVLGGAGDVNGDGYADVIVSAHYYDSGQLDEGVGLVFLGGGRGGRQVLARQVRSDGSGLPVQAWGGSGVDGRFRLAMRGTDPQGRGRAKLEAEFCPPGTTFGSPSCGHFVSPVWHDVTASAGGVALEEEISGLLANTLYRWRVRVLHAPFGVDQPGITAPPNPAHGPWRRLSGQAVEGDIRTGLAGVSVETTSPDLSFAIEDVRPNPSPGEFAVTFVLPATGPAKLEMFDVAGRRVLARDLAFGQGRRTITLREGRSLAPGIYLLRLSHGAGAASARVVILE